MCGVGIKIFVREFPTVVSVKTSVLGNVAPCNVVDTDVSGECAASLFRDPEMNAPGLSETSVITQ
jgi:hypothetical protein